ncbi:MAG: hypothetical protein IPJ71_04925 [Bdellovibrionales bacterium]|nr:hypothetical protein [Bdellovibrionales bacterium]
MSPIKLINCLFCFVLSILPWSTCWSSQPIEEGKCLHALAGSRDYAFSSPLTREDLENFWKPGARSKLIKEIDGFARDLPSDGILARGMRVTRRDIERIRLAGMKPSDSITHKLFFDHNPKVAILHAFMGSRRADFSYPGPQEDYFAAVLNSPNTLKKEKILLGL